MSRWVRDRDEYEHGSKWFADWHREALADLSTMIDIDCLGYCTICLEPLYIVEATRSKRRKTASVSEHLARSVRCLMYVVYRDDAAHPGEMLVDDRSTPRHYGWVLESEARDIFEAVRSDHSCRNDEVA